MSVAVKRDLGLCVLQLEGEIDVRGAAELKLALLDALSASEGAAVRIDLAQTTAVDITALQLLWAAARDAEQKEIVFSVAEPVPEGIGAVICGAGFEKLFRLPRESPAVPPQADPHDHSR